MTDSDVRKDAPSEASKVKQRLSAHVQHRMANPSSVDGPPSGNAGEHREEHKTMNADNIKIERDVDGQSRDNDGDDDDDDAGAPCSNYPAGGPSDAPSPVVHPPQCQSAIGSSFMAGNLMLSNSILDEVLNEKKLALLQSPEVVRFLKEAQNKANKSK